MPRPPTPSSPGSPREGVAVAQLAEYSAVPGDEPAGIVFGYAGPGDTLLAEGLARIRAAIIAAT